MSIPIKFPFITTASDYHEFEDHLIFIEKIVDENVLPPSTLELRQLAYVEVGGYTNDGYYAVVYSPSQLGRRLSGAGQDTWEYCAPLLFDYFNADYHKSTRAKNRSDYIPFNKISKNWINQALTDEVDFHALYEKWAAQKQHAAISSQIQQTSKSKSKSKI